MSDSDNIQVGSIPIGPDGNPTSDNLLSWKRGVWLIGKPLLGEISKGISRVQDGE